LEGIVRKDAQKYRNRAEASELLLQVKERLVQAQPSDDFMSLYEIEKSFEQSLYSYQRKQTLVNGWRNIPMSTLPPSKKNENLTKPM